MQLYWLVWCAALMATASLMATTMCVGEADATATPCRPSRSGRRRRSTGGVESKKAKLPFMLRDGADVGVMRSHESSWQVTVFAIFGLENVNNFKGEYSVWLVLKVGKRLKVQRFPYGIVFSAW
jgi:hypothetical protein